MTALDFVISLGSLSYGLLLGRALARPDKPRARQRKPKPPSDWRSGGTRD